MSKLLNNIEHVFNTTNVSFDDYEIIIADNREKYKNEPVNWARNKVTILGTDKPRALYTSRHEAFDLCTGDYVWFVDGDDLLIKIPEVTAYTDIIGFSFYEGSCDADTAIGTLLAKKQVRLLDGISDKSTKIKDNLFLNQYVICSYPMVWPKLFKHNVLKAAYGMLPNEVDIIASEDLLLWAACLYNSKSISYYDEACYFYNKAFSLNNTVCTYEQYSRMIRGIDTSISIMHDLFPNEDKWINIAARSHCYIFAGKLLLIKDDKERIEAARLLLHIFSPADIEKNMLRYYLNNDITDRRTIIKTLLEFDKLFCEGEPTLDKFIRELDYDN